MAATRTPRRPRGVDVRRTAERLLASGHNVTATAAAVGVNRSSVQRWRRLRFAPPSTGSGGRPSRLGDCVEALQSFLASRPTATQAEMVAEVQRVCGVSVSRSRMSRWLQLLGITRKRVVRVNTEIERVNVSAARAAFLSEMWHARRRWTRYFNVDESGWHLNASSGYGYALRGHRAVARRPAVRGQRFSLTLVIGAAPGAGRSGDGGRGAAGGCVGWKLVKGSVTASIFREFIAELELPRGSTLVMDNARIHHASHSLTRQGLPTIRETLANSGVKGRYLPPYSPDVAPVELVFNSLRTAVNAAEPRTEAQLRAAISVFMEKLTTEQVMASYRHCWRQRKVRHQFRTP